MELEEEGTNRTQLTQMQHILNHISNRGHCSKRYMFDCTEIASQVFHKATVIVVGRGVSSTLKLTCTPYTLSPPAALTASHPPDTLVNKYYRG